MDMVNDGKDIRLDTPQAVKEALASGKDLYNPQTGEFWWEYNYTGSIANTYVHLDDPNLLAVVDNPDFDLYEDIVGGLNYTGYITDSIETIIEDGEENAPLIDPRDEVFAQIASEDGWVIASPENVRKAVQSHMAENGADAPGKKNGMDKTAEIAAWKEKHVPIDRNGDDALVMHKMADGSREFIVAHGYDEETGHWGHGTYYDSLASAAADLEGRAISTPGMEVICPDFWYRDDIESALEEAGLEVNGTPTAPGSGTPTSQQEQVDGEKPCEHDWTVTYKTVHHDAVTHTENVPPVYEAKTSYHTVCNDCQQTIDGIADAHIKDTGHSGYSTNVPITGEVLVSEGFTREVTDSPAYDESVPDKLVCTLCGEEKPATAE